MNQVIQPYQIVQNNYGQKLDFTIVDGQGNVVDLTGAAVTLKVQRADDPTNSLLALGGSVTIDAAAQGTCHYTVAQGDFTSPGKYLGELVVAVSGVSSISAPGIVILVQPTLPQTNN
jgi:hypothetical protein